MLEPNHSTTEPTPEQTPAPAALPTPPSVPPEASESRIGQMINVMEGWSKNLRTADQFAYLLARRTPITLVICLTLLLAGVIGSRLNVWLEPFLWGIPSLGAISMGLGFWIISATILSHPNLTTDARTVLQRAVRLQWVMLAAAALTLIYFAGMAFKLW